MPFLPLLAWVVLQVQSPKRCNLKTLRVLGRPFDLVSRVCKVGYGGSHRVRGGGGGVWGGVLSRRTKELPSRLPSFKPKGCLDNQAPVCTSSDK